MRHPFIQIEDRKIGYDYEPLIIAEIGINHNGDLDVAKQMVLSAAKAGAEVVKHQTHIVEDEMSDLAKNTIPGNADKSIYEIMSDCSLNEQEEFELMEYSKSLGLIFISTPFSRAAVDRLEKFGMPAYKIGSGECNNLPLVDYIASKKKPIILSTGMNSLNSVRETVDVIRKHNVPFALLHTTNLYPTPDHLVRLGAITELIENFPDAVVGLSDHTVDNIACFGAIALGASILERHYTDSMEREGPDICCSMDPRQLSDLISGARRLFMQRGGSKEELLGEEQVTRDFAYSTVVTIKDIRKGEAFTKDNLWVKRPGIGEIFARDYDKVLAKIASHDIPMGHHLSWNDIHDG